MKRTINEVNNTDIEHKSNKLIKSCTNFIDSFRRSNNFNDCLDEIVKVMLPPVIEDVTFNDFNNVMNSDEFWNDIITMEAEASSLSTDESEGFHSINYLPPKVESHDHQNSDLSAAPYMANYQQLVSLDYSYAPQSILNNDFETSLTPAVSRSWRSLCQIRSYKELVHRAESSKLAITITENRAPFRICYVNNAWIEACEFSKSEALGKTMRLIQGPATCMKTVSRVMNDVYRGKGSSAELINYTKTGRAFHNRMRISPVQDLNGRITHFMGLIFKPNSI